MKIQNEASGLLLPVATPTDSLQVGENLHASAYDSFGVLEDVVRRCQEEGALPARAEADALSLLGWAEVHGLALLCNEGVIGRMSEAHGGSEKRTIEMIFAIMKTRLQK